MTEVAAIRLREFFFDRELDYAVCDGKVLRLGSVIRSNDHFSLRLH